MKPIVQSFTDDTELEAEVIKLAQQGIPKKHLYVLSHDKDRTKRVADNAGANTIGMQEIGVGTSIENAFREKGDELRASLKELGFNAAEASEHERSLDHGNILLILDETSK